MPFVYFLRFQKNDSDCLLRRLSACYDFTHGYVLEKKNKIFFKNIYWYFVCQFQQSEQSDRSKKKGAVYQLELRKYRTLPLLPRQQDLLFGGNRWKQHADEYSNIKNHLSST